MKIYKIPNLIKTIIFDIDSTLYTNSKYAYEQVDCQIRQWAFESGISCAEARKRISEFRQNYSNEHEGKKISLGNTFVQLGVPIEKSIEWRKSLLEPKNFLSVDSKLQMVLQKLKQKYKLICVTNNPVLPASKTLDALGVSDFFEGIVGLDTCFKSKPAREPFETACQITESLYENVLCIGDRFDMDIDLPLQMGMGGILVAGVEDVYNLAKII